MLIGTVELGGRRLRVGHRAGEPTLLIFNGIGADIELMRPLIEALEGFGIVIFDMPGIGGSAPSLLPYSFAAMAQLADELLGRLGHDGAVDVMGYSWGGALAQQFVRQYPERCRKLVLAATTAGAVMIPGQPASWARLAGSLHQTGNRIGQLYQLMATVGWTSIHWLHRLAQPCLVLTGERDTIVPPANGLLLASHLANARLQSLEGGHLFIRDQAASVAKTLRTFLREEGSTTSSQGTAS
ncbi:MAG TPA: alpha/beta fold hydrolase [Aliidongia sp.]|nr:alpha/beta fold hydrolase [Aliidongia sp.]